jgi:hypothetical protein
MKKAFLLLCITTSAATALNAQQTKTPDAPKNDQKNAVAAKAVIIKSDSTPLELAKAAIAAHGGDKFKNAKTIVQRGTVEATAPNSTQAVPAAYAVVTKGEKFRFEITSQFFNFLQIYDGEQLYTSIARFDVPPLNKIGFILLGKAEDAGYKISALPDKKKRRGFRISTPDGYSSDFYIDAMTGQVMSYEAKFTVDGREITTAVENDKFRDVNGVILPEKYSQRLELGQMTLYASFKAKEILVNSDVVDDVFRMQ